jgi:membrane-bound lytic murein transglycosylase A
LTVRPPADRPRLARAGDPWRTVALAALGGLALALPLALWALSELLRDPVAAEVRARERAPAPELPPLRTLEPAGFAALPGWSEDRHGDALEALRASCADGVERGTDLGAAAAPALEALCARLRSAGRVDGEAARRFFETEFVPYAVGDRGERVGLLTGYYEPELEGDRRRRPPFVHPLYLAPDDRMVVDLGEFKRDLAGRKITGMIRGGRFRPYFDRAEIERGALRGRRLELLWVRDPVALFFLQIQGSGRVRLPDGEVVRVGYDGQNGHDYTAIGRVLVERGELALEQVSLQSIRAWLRAHPDQSEAVMNANRSYVFFRRLPGAGPVGAEGVAITPWRSAAVDDERLPYGLPLWLDSTLPAVPELGRDETPLRRLVVAQDTGGAIVGPVRADLFLGPGEEAEQTAGRMKQPLRTWLLWPRAAPPPPAEETVRP